MNNLYDLLFEMSFRPFDLNTLKRIKEFQDIKTYINSTLKRSMRFVGAGGSRRTYRLNSKKVLKLAIHDGGILQNETEYEVNQKFPQFTTKVFEPHDPNFIWIISEIADPMTLPELTKYIGIDPKILKLIGSGHTKSYNSVEFLYELLTDPEQVEELKAGDLSLTDELENILWKNKISPNQFKNWVINKQQLLLDLINFSRDSGLLFIDFGKPGQWGRTADGRVVLLDYGYSKDNYEDILDAQDDWIDDGRPT